MPPRTGPLISHSAKDHLQHALNPRVYASHATALDIVIMITHEQCERVRVPASLKEGGFKIPPTSAVLAAQFLLHQTQNVVSSPNSLNLQQFFFCDILDRKAHFSQAPSPPSINSCLALNAVRLFNSSPKRDTSAVSADVISPTSKQNGDVDVSCG